MAREQNIFYQLVTDENSTTEVLCNLLQYGSFRKSLFTAMFPGSKYSGGVAFDSIDTQLFSRESGCPDVTIDDSEFVAFIEVKTNPTCAPTPHQPTGYLKELLKKAAESQEQWLCFLIPEKWIHREFVERQVQEFRSTHQLTTVQISFFTWEEVIDLLEENDFHRLNVALADFHQILVQRYRPEPLSFNYQEIQTMFSDEIPRTLEKLDSVITGVQNKSTGYRVEHKRVGKGLCPSENGLYFYDSKNRKILFFGEWTQVWKTSGHPLCYGVDRRWAHAESFRQLCSKVESIGGWYIGVIPEEVFGKADVTTEIWKILEPLLSRLTQSEAS